MRDGTGAKSALATLALFLTAPWLAPAEGGTEPARVIQTAGGAYQSKAVRLGQDDFLPWKRNLSL